MDVIVFKNDQGSLSVLSTLLDIVDAVKIHNLTDYIIVDDSLLPIEPIESWVLTNGEIKVNPHKLIEFNRQNMPTLPPIEFDIKLVDAGLYDQVQELISKDIKLRIAYTRATFFSRVDPFVTQASESLELTPEQVDEIWTS